MTAVIDLNADVGEGFGSWTMGDDEALVGLVSSANVACGFHAGDPSTMARVCAFAAERGVAVGAHVAYRDLAGFGRRDLDIAPDELIGDVLYQLGALDAFARAAGTHLSYVKPHGALYNRIAIDPVQAEGVLEAVRRFDASLPVLTLPASSVHAVAAGMGIATITEAFPDRLYEANGQLVSRSQRGAVLHDPDVVARRAVRMATNGRLTAVDGSEVDVAARSLCVHGDTPEAVAIATAVRRALETAGITVQPFA
jgi:UPF0271 protein